jgi:hypothetical protein
MKTLSSKEQEKARQMAASHALQKQENREPTSQFIDNRPEAIVQRKMQALANKSVQSEHLKTLQRMVSDSSSTHPIQRRETHRISRDTTPFIHEFTSQAIDNGAPSRLTYLINKDSVTYVQDAYGRIYHKSAIEEEKGDTQYFPIDLHSLNRKKALSRGVQLDGNSRSHAQGLSRDEYPYASTYEGGTDSFWSYVPVSEQNTQGGQLSGLYRRVIESGDPEFDVEVD